MADAELNELEALAKAATPGPWKADSLNNVRHRSGTVIHATIAYIEPRATDAAYISAANPTVVLELIAELRKERDHLTNWIARAIWLARQLESKDIPCEDWLQKSIEGLDKEVSEFEKMLRGIKHD